MRLLPAVGWATGVERRVSGDGTYAAVDGGDREWGKAVVSMRTAAVKGGAGASGVAERVGGGYGVGLVVGGHARERRAAGGSGRA